MYKSINSNQIESFIIKILASSADGFYEKTRLVKKHGGTQENLEDCFTTVICSLNFHGCERREIMKKPMAKIMLALLLIGAATLMLKIQPSNSKLTSLEDQIIALVNGARAYDYDLELENIAYSHPAFRAGGSGGATEAANWIKAQFESFGLEAWLEPFEFPTWDLLSKSSLTIDEDGNQETTGDQTEIASFQCEQYSWPTPENGAFADLVILPLPEAASYDEIGINPINMTEWNAIDTTSKIVLVGKEVTWDLFWNRAFFNKRTSQQPAAIVHTWWYDWMSFAGPERFIDNVYRKRNIPAGFISYGDGMLIRNKENMNVSACVSVRSVVTTTNHYNVVGRIEGVEDPTKLVIVSGHYDSAMCSGFCDNGAGTAGVIEIAKVFADAFQKGYFRPSYTLLFVAFASEELGRVGSINYVKQHKSEMPNIRAVINLDCIGSDELYVDETEPADGFDLDSVVLSVGEDLGIDVIALPGGGSDHETFRDPSWSDFWYRLKWGIDANISDAAPVNSSALLSSGPVYYDEKWYGGSSGWIHNEYDNSTSTATLNWVEVDDLENHIKVAALTTMRVSSNVLRHDIAVVNITPYKTIVGKTYPMYINVTIANQGNYTDTFTLNVYANETLIATVTDITLESGCSITKTVTWDTTNFAYGNHTISAFAIPISTEINTANNMAVDGTVLLSCIGDVNGDQMTNIIDILMIIGRLWTTPSSPRWNPNMDINNDLKVNINDILIALHHVLSKVP